MPNKARFAVAAVGFLAATCLGLWAVKAAGEAEEIATAPTAAVKSVEDPKAPIVRGQNLPRREPRYGAGGLEAERDEEAEPIPTTVVDPAPEPAWRVLASDGSDNRRAHRAAYPVFDLDLRQVGTLDAPYPSNLPWPTLVPAADGRMLMVGFDGTTTGGRLAGYGTHGAVVIAREVSRGQRESRSA